MSRAVEVLEEFAAAAKAPNGRRHFDAEAFGTLERGERKGKDWSAFIAKRQDRRAPDACWPWRGGTRIGIDDGRRYARGGGRKQARPSRVMEFRRLIWMITNDVEIAKLPRFVYSRCGDEWCSNPRHLTIDPKDRPKRVVTIMSAKTSNRTVPSIVAARKLPTAPGLATATSRAEDVLGEVAKLLAPLAAADRRRVISAVRAFYGDEVAS